MRDAAGVDDRVCDGLDTRYPLPRRDGPNELGGPFDL